MDEDARRFELFATLFAAAMLFQLASVLWTVAQLEALTLPGFVELALLFACLGVIWHPSPQTLGLVALIQLFNFWISLPHMPNHRLITAAVNFGVLVAWAGTGSAGELYRRLAPALRWSALVVYFFAVFHKLNVDFLNPEVSCTTLFFGHIRAAMPILPAHPLILSTLPTMTLFFEGMAPLLLFFARTRSAGIVLIFFFHSVLALDVEKHFFDFTSTMFALLTAFLPEDFLANIRKQMLQRPIPTLHAGRLIFTVWYLVSMIAGFFHVHPLAFDIFFGGRQLLWWALNALMGYLLFLGLRGSLSGALSFRPRPSLVIVPVFLAANGIGPYLGIKTRSALDMYSNLRVEGTNPNHLIVRQGADLFGTMHDLIKIVSTSDLWLTNNLVNPGMLMTYFEFRRFTSSHPDIAVTYERNGIVRTVARVGNDDELKQPWPLFWDKLLWYRPVDPNPHARCQW